MNNIPILERRAIETTFTYDEQTDTIGWFLPACHRSPHPKLHKVVKYLARRNQKARYHEVCYGRGGKQFKVENIKQVLRKKED